jgi:iron complex outermembrane receptor protein
MSAKGIFLGSAAMLAFCAAPAWAAVEQARRPAAQPEATTNATDNSDPGIGEIIVTANKRAQNQQVVPISIVAFTGESLKTQGVMNVVDLPQITPG